MLLQVTSGPFGGRSTESLLSPSSDGLQSQPTFVDDSTFMKEMTLPDGTKKWVKFRRVPEQKVFARRDTGDRMTTPKSLQFATIRDEMLEKEEEPPQMTYTGHTRQLSAQLEMTSATARRAVNKFASRWAPQQRKEVQEKKEKQVALGGPRRG